MPTWPTLWPKLLTGETNIKYDHRPSEPLMSEKIDKDRATERHGLSSRQQQLLYECEEERMVVKACLRELVKLKRTEKHTSWDTADAANMGFS